MYFSTYNYGVGSIFQSIWGGFYLFFKILKILQKFFKIPFSFKIFKIFLSNPSIWPGTSSPAPLPVALARAGRPVVRGRAAVRRRTPPWGGEQPVAQVLLGLGLGVRVVRLDRSHGDPHRIGGGPADVDVRPHPGQPPEVGDGPDLLLHPPLLRLQDPLDVSSLGVRGPENFLEDPETVAPLHQVWHVVLELVEAGPGFFPDPAQGPFSSGCLLFIQSSKLRRRDLWKFLLVCLFCLCSFLFLTFYHFIILSFHILGDFYHSIILSFYHFFPGCFTC